MCEVWLDVAENCLEGAVARDIKLAHHHVESIPEDLLVVRVHDGCTLGEIRASRESIWKEILQFVFDT